MIAGDYAVDFLLRGFMQGAGFRLVVDERNHVGAFAGIGRRKEFMHGAERHIALQILVHIVAVTDALQGANHFEPDAVEQNRAADRGPPEKKSAPGFIAQHDYRTLLRIVHFIQPAALMDGQVTNLMDRCGNAIDSAAGLVEVADGADVAAPNHPGGRRHARTVAHNVLVVTEGKVILPQRGETTLHHRSTARPDKHYIFTDGGELLTVAGPESLSNSDQQEQGTNTPGDSEHGQERAQFVRPESGQSLAEDIEEQAH